MTASQTFLFGAYTLRPADDGDMPLAVKWTAADADHAGRTRPEFWFETNLGRDSYMLEDTEGPVFFFKIHRLSINVVELHCQFPTDEVTKERVQAGILEGFAWLETELKKTKVEYLFFDSSFEPLRAFTIRRLGFSALSGTKLSKVIGGN